MKKCVPALFLLMSAIVLFAEEVPVADGGTWGLFVEMDDLRFNAAGARYLISDDLALGAGLYFVWTREFDPATAVFQAALSPFIQYTFFRSGPFAFYGGGFTDFDLTTENRPNVDTRITTFIFRIGPMAGLDWFLGNTVSLGARYRAFYQSERIATRAGGITFSTSGNSIRLSGYPEFILTFYLP